HGVPLLRPRTACRGRGRRRLQRGGTAGSLAVPGRRGTDHARVSPRPARGPLGNLTCAVGIPYHRLTHGRDTATHAPSLARLGTLPVRQGELSSLGPRVPRDAPAERRARRREPCGPW